MSSVCLLDLNQNHQNFYRHRLIYLYKLNPVVCPSLCHEYKYTEPDWSIWKNCISDFCGLTVGCFPLCPTHWASRVEVIGGYHEYTDVKSCQDVVHLYHLLWSATILNIVALFLGIITAAVLGGFKDMVSEVTEELSARLRVGLSVWICQYELKVSFFFLSLSDSLDCLRELVWARGPHSSGPLRAASTHHVSQLVLQHCPLPAAVHCLRPAGTDTWEHQCMHS